MEHLTVPFIAFSNWLAALSPISAQGFDERISVIEVEIPVQVLHKGEPVEGLLDGASSLQNLQDILAELVAQKHRGPSEQQPEALRPPRLVAPEERVASRRC